MVPFLASWASFAAQAQFEAGTALSLKPSFFPGYLGFPSLTSLLAPLPGDAKLFLMAKSLPYSCYNQLRLAACLTLWPERYIELEVQHRPDRI